MAEEQIGVIKDERENTQNLASTSSSSSSQQANVQMRREQNPFARRLTGPIKSTNRRKSGGVRNPKRSSPIRSIFNAVVTYLYNDPTFLEPLSADEACQLYALHKQATGIDVSMLGYASNTFYMIYPYKRKVKILIDSYINTHIFILLMAY